MTPSKIKSASEMAAIRDELDRLGKRLVLTNGCFDLLHVGHVRYLQAARDLGDALVVAVNGDTSVRSLKGPSRPINTENDRSEVVSALGSVDYVLIFPSMRVTDVIAEIQPHVYAKGGDYTVETLDPAERKALEKAGTEIHIMGLTPGKSTSDLVSKIVK
jgi:rfaE bifunctional protein nucleotidyltransferase chain/domain